MCSTFLNIQFFVCWWLLICGCFAGEFDIEQACQLDKGPELQIVFALDGLVNEGDDSIYKTHQGAIMTYLMGRFEDEFTAEFALVAFWGFPENIKSHKKSDGDTCYKLIQGFTSDSSKIKKGAKSLAYKYKQGYNKTASSIAAVLMAIQDKRLHWNKGFLKDDEQTVRKIIVLITSHAPTIEVSGTAGKRPFQLDGTDTCMNTLPPTPVLWENTVLDNDVLIVASVLNLSQDSSSDGDATDTYFWNFRRTRVLYQHYAYPNPSESIDAGEKITQKHFHPHCEEIREAIEEEIWSCEWEHPPSYNTVGL